MAKRQKSYLKEAKAAFDEIKRLHEYSNRLSYSQAKFHFNKLGECYSKSMKNLAGDAVVIQDMHSHAARMMEELKKLEDEPLPGTGSPSP